MEDEQDGSHGVSILYRLNLLEIFIMINTHFHNESISLFIKTILCFREWEEIRMVYERDPADILLQDVSTEYYPW